jgi:hypothetical protein
VNTRGGKRRKYCDTGVSGSKDSRPALDLLVKDAKRRRFDTLVVWKMDRLGRNLKHLITLLDELQSLGIAFVSIGEGIDCTTPAGKLQMPYCAKKQISNRFNRHMPEVSFALIHERSRFPWCPPAIWPQLFR